jgi:hypothetical protein
MNYSISFPGNKNMRRNAARGFSHLWGRAGSFSLILASLVIAGCDNNLASVSGTVTLDGVPVEGSPDLYGTVAFYREDGSGAPAIGIIEGAGQYELATGTKRGLEPGNYMVGVAVKKILPPAEPGGLTQPQRLSDPKYARPEESGFRADVKPGDNTFDFAINSQPRK